MRNCRWILVLAMLILVWAGVASGQTTATLTLPDTTAASGDTVAIPLTVATNLTIGLAQFVIEFDSTIIKFQNAVIGKDVTNFMLFLNLYLPFSATTSGTNANVLIQLSGGGIGSFSGQGKEAVKLQFVAVKSSNKSPLVFDRATNHTFLTTTDLKDITGANITFVDGSLEVGPTDVKIEEETILPSWFALRQNYPNPFNPETCVKYELPQRTKVRIKIINLLGQEVQTLVDQDKPAGYFEVLWDGKDKTGRRVSSGIYLYRIEAGDFVQTRKMQLIQ